MASPSHADLVYGRGGEAFAGAHGKKLLKAAVGFVVERVESATSSPKPETPVTTAQAVLE
ncbi:MAG: hypothetical protein R2856_18450 [Caldilineaceae bacterium]